MNIFMRLIICFALTAFSLSAHAQSNNKGATPVEVENGPSNPVPVVVQNQQSEITVAGEVNVTNMPDVFIANTPDVAVANTPNVTVVNDSSLPIPVTVKNSTPVLAPGSSMALGLTCVSSANENGMSCEYINPTNVEQGMIVTHISLMPLVSILGTEGTVCLANAGVGGALLGHSWAANRPLGTNISLPFSVQILAPIRPTIFVSKSGDITKSCGVRVIWHGYMPTS